MTQLLDRRSLLKFFGIGTVIAPVGCAEVRARLLAEPQVDIIPAKTFPDGHQPELFRDRLKWNPYEAIWLYMWQIENNPPSGVNYGIGPLEHILGREPTDAEKVAVAGLMQWFGTNCGSCFIQETLEACGYSIGCNGNPRSIELQNLRHANVWPKEPRAAAVSFQYRGRTICLRPNEEGFVI